MNDSQGWQTIQKLVFDTQQIPVFGDTSKCLKSDSVLITVKFVPTVFPVSNITNIRRVCLSWFLDTDETD